MLDLSCFDSDVNGLHYYGADHYHITLENGAYAIAIDRMDENGDAIMGQEKHICSTLSSAIATIEAMENGEEV